MSEREHCGIPSLGRLRSMTEADLGMVLNWRNHPSIRTYMYTQQEITLEEHRAWWERVRLSEKQIFFIYERNDVPLGYVTFSDIAAGPATAAWGFYTAPEAPKGTGSLMTFQAMDKAFGPLGLRKLNAEAIGSNAASIALHKTFGFELEGVFRDHVLVSDRLEDVYRLALFSDRWTALRPTKLLSLSKRVSR